MTRAFVAGNPSARDTTGVVHATFDLETALVPNAAALEGWKVRKWDGTEVDVAWWEPFVSHPDGSVMTATAEWVDTISAGANRLQVDMVRGSNSAPSFVMDSTIDAIVNQGEAHISWTDDDPDWTPLTAQEREFSYDVLRVAREGEAISAPGHAFELWQDRGLSRVYRYICPVGRGHHHDWLGNTIQGLLYVHAYLTVYSGSTDAQLRWHFRNTAAFHDDALPASGSGPGSGSPSQISTTDFPLVRHLGDLQVRFHVPGVDVQFRPWGTRDFGSGDGPCPVQRLDGASESKRWDLNIRGLGMYKRYPICFALAWGSDRWANSTRAARYPWLRYAWGGVNEHRAAVRRGNFAGGESAYGIAAGGWEIPPPPMAQSLIDGYNAESEQRLDAFLNETMPRTRFNGVIEPASNPYNLLGYEAGPGGAGGAMKQFGWFQEPRAIFGHSHGDMMRDAVSSMRFLSIQIGTVELREDERSVPRDPGEIPHDSPGFNWGNRDTYIHFDSTGPVKECGLQMGRRDGASSGAQRPIYTESGNRCDTNNPDTREAFPDINGNRRRWKSNNPEHWGIRPGWVVVRAVQDPLLWNICEEHADYAFYGLPDGYFPHRTLRRADNGGGTRARKRMWRTALLGGYFLRKEQKYVDRILEQVWRMDNGAFDHTWTEPWQVRSSGRPEFYNMKLCGDPNQAGYDQADHHDYLWQSAQATTFFTYLAYLVANMTGATSAYPSESTLREDAAERIAEIARQTTYKAITQQIGVPAVELGLMPRTLDSCIDWSDPRHTYRFWWHRKQGYGSEVLAGEGGQPSAPNRLVVGVNSGNGRTVGTTGEETNWYPMLKAARIWFDHPDFTADVQARLAHIIERLEAFESHLATGENYDGISGYSSGEWVEGTVTQRPSLWIEADPAVGASPLTTQIQARGRAPVDPSGAIVEFWWDWNEGSTAPADLVASVGSENFSMIIPNVFTATPSQTRFTVRAVLRQTDGNTSEARTVVEATSSILDAEFEFRGANGYAPVQILLTDTTAGVVTSREWRAFNEFGDELTETGVQEWEPIIEKIGTWSVELTVGNGINFDTELKRDLVIVEEYISPRADGLIDTLSGSAPLDVSITNRSNYRGMLSWGEDSEIDTNPGDVHEHTYSTGGVYVVTLSSVSPTLETAVWQATIDVGTIAVAEDMTVALPASISTGVIPDFTIANQPTNIIATLPLAKARSGVKDLVVSVTTNPTTASVALPAAISVGIADDLVVSDNLQLTLSTVMGLGRSMGHTEAGDPLTDPRVVVRVDAEVDLPLVSGSGVVPAQDYQDRSDLTALIPAAVALADAPMRISTAGSGGTPAEIDLPLCAGLANAIAITAETDVSGIDAVTQLVIDGKYVEEVSIVGSVAEATENITGFVRGSRKTLKVPIKDGAGNYIPATTLRSSYAHIHIFAAATSEVPLVSLTATVDLTAADGPEVSYTFQRGDTAGLAGNTDYFYRVELEFDGDADLPILSGTFTTANQPAMRDDIR